MILPGDTLVVKTQELWRTFCALEIPPEVAQRLSRHIDHLKKAFPQVQASWNPDGKFHLTLKFIGEIPGRRIEKLSLAAARASQQVSPFPLVVGGTGAFPAQGPPKVLWIGISDPSTRLGQLYDLLEAETAREGFAREARRFSPHLTIARLRKPEGVRALAAAHQETSFESLEFTVFKLLVIRSELSSKGSRYTLISEHPLTLGA